MSQLLVLYEIASRASKVTSRKALREFEKFIRQTLETYQDAAIRQVAHIHLFRLKEQYSV